MSKSSAKPPSELALRDLVSSTLKRQHLLGAVPPAMRFIPIGALAAKALYDNGLGKDRHLLGGSDEKGGLLSDTTDREAALREGAMSGTTTGKQDEDKDKAGEPSAL